MCIFDFKKFDFQNFTAVKMNKIPRRIQTCDLWFTHPIPLNYEDMQPN